MGTCTAILDVPIWEGRKLNVHCYTFAHAQNLNTCEHGRQTHDLFLIYSQNVRYL